MTSATMTIRLEAREKALIADYAKAFGTSASDFMRRTALERIEDELDLRAWEDAKAEFNANPMTVSHEEVMRKFGLQ